jgi:hypothetical protein
MISSWWNARKASSHVRRGNPHQPTVAVAVSSRGAFANCLFDCSHDLIEVKGLADNLVEVLIASGNLVNLRGVGRREHDSALPPRVLILRVLKELPLALIGHRDIPHDYGRIVLPYERLKIQSPVADVVYVACHHREACLLQHLTQQLGGVGTGIEDSDDVRCVHRAERTATCCRGHRVRVWPWSSPCACRPA